jgi:hypothetical protein
MGRMTYVVGLTDDMQTAVLQLNKNETGLAHMTFDAAELENLIHNLATVRAQMLETVPPDLDVGSRLSVVEHPAWKVPAKGTVQTGKAVLALRHPGMGWLGFLLEADRLSKISAALSSSVKDD